MIEQRNAHTKEEGMNEAINSEYWFSPTLKSRLRIVVSTAQTQGQLVQVEFENQPQDIGPPYHVHPRQEERFQVIEGRLAFRLAGEQREIGPGETLVVPPNAPHTFWNPGMDPVRFTSEHRPALGFERFITTLYDLDDDGKADAAGVPSLLQLMVMLRARPGEEFIAGPPRIAQRIGAAVLGTVGGWLGRRAVYVSERRKLEAAHA
jgi:mannose-6-phosphate isomerase-like protein (cupin superfamily)